MTRKQIDPIIARVTRPLIVVLIHARVTPNLLTLIGGMLSCVGAGFIAVGKLKTGMSLLIFTWLFDVLDGALAKYSGQTSKFGGFLDSVMDRYTEGLVFAAFVFHYASTGDSLMAGLTAIALIGAMAVSYARARAENEINSCTVGIGDRLVRLVIMAVSTMAGAAGVGIVIVLVLGHFTVLQRVLYTYGELWASKDLEISGGSHHEE